MSSGVNFLIFDGPEDKANIIIIKEDLDAETKIKEIAYSYNGKENNVILD